MSSSSVPSAGPTASTSQAAGARRGALPCLLAGTFMSVLDFFIINVAIPSLQSGLRAASSSIELVIVCYAVGYGSLMITGGRLGDLLGRRRMYLAGMALFTLASGACGFAPSVAFLIVARAAQGMSAALMGPQVLALIGTLFAGERKTRAIGAYAVTMGVAAVSGQLAGGLLIQLDFLGLGWRSCFLVNLLVGPVALALVPRLVGESRAPGRSRLDVAGMALVTLALLAIVIPLTLGRERGWPLWSWLCLAGALPLMGAFLLLEYRLAAKGRSPLVDLSLFRERAFSVGLLSQLVFWTGQASYFLILALYLQGGRLLSALDAGLVFAALGAGYLLTSTTVGPIARRLGKNVMAAGGLLRAVALAALAFIVSRAGAGVPIAWIVPALALDGAGMGLAIAPLAATVLSRVASRHAGAAAGVLATASQVGNAVGVAAIGIVFYGTLGGATAPEAFVRAFGAGLLCLIGVEIALALVVQLLPGKADGAGRSSE